MSQYKVQSMTGYGRAQGECAPGRLTVEIRTVNNRFQDIAPSLPRELGGLENHLRRALKDAVPRGKIDCRVRFQPAPESQAQVTVRADIAAAYARELAKLADAGVRGEPTLELIARLPGVVETHAAELDDQALWDSHLAPLVAEAIEKLNADRAREGEELAANLDSLAAQVSAQRDAIEARKQEIVDRIRRKLAERIKQIESETGAKFEQGRLEAEVAVLAERADIAEELTRLAAHMTQFTKLLRENDGSVGKSLDFLVQEIHREVNTICSKSRETELTQAGLTMKNLVEQMREQIQNIQ